jgi:hypothetical protein
MVYLPGNEYTPAAYTCHQSLTAYSELAHAVIAVTNFNLALLYQRCQ